MTEQCHFDGGFLSNLTRKLAGGRRGPVKLVSRFDSKTPILTPILREAFCQNLASSCMTRPTLNFISTGAIFRPIVVPEASLICFVLPRMSISAVGHRHPLIDCCGQRAGSEARSNWLLWLTPQAERWGATQELRMEMYYRVQSGHNPGNRDAHFTYTSRF